MAETAGYLNPAVCVSFILCCANRAAIECGPRIIYSAIAVRETPCPATQYITRDNTTTYNSPHK